MTTDEIDLSNEAHSYRRTDPVEVRERRLLDAGWVKLPGGRFSVNHEQRDGAHREIVADLEWAEDRQLGWDRARARVLKFQAFDKIRNAIDEWRLNRSRAAADEAIAKIDMAIRKVPR